MKPQILFVIAIQILFSIVAARAEEKVMLFSSQSDDETTNTLRLGEGESAVLVYARQYYSNASSPAVRLIITKGDRVFTLSGAGNGGDLAPVTITGPAAIKLDYAGASFTNPHVATFSVTRVGTASNPSAIPLEAGSNFQVILESSSDLVNWTPANPGEYSGTEAKRFFRTRIVKK